MHLTALHIVLTYQCLFECGHCFIWGSPTESGIFHLDRLDAILDQATALGTIEALCYEGGETFVYYPILIAAVRHAAARRFRTAVITNGYWANSAEQARMWLGRLVDAGLQQIFFVADSRSGAALEMATHTGLVVAQEMGLATSIIGADARAVGEQSGAGPAGWPQLACGRVALAAGNSAPRAWQTFTACPYGELASPGHVHVDPLGDVHLCRGLILGNLFECPLDSLAAHYAPERDPILGPLLAGGPAALVARYGLQPDPVYADPCQLCRHGQALFRSRFPAGLAETPAIGCTAPGDEKNQESVAG